MSLIRRENTYCLIISVILVVVFIFKTVIDYLQYDEMVNSAPFYLWVVVNGIHFIIPAVILFVIGIVIGKRKKYE